MSISIGDSILVKALKADGHCYRWWTATVEAVDAQSLITVTTPGNAVGGTERSWISRHYIRTIYWLEQPYNLLEVYTAEGTLAEIYVHISSSAWTEQDTLYYTDHELDVVKQPDQAAFIVDQDEFAAASITYHYTPEFQTVCYQTAEAALRLVESWVPKGFPG